MKYEEILAKQPIVYDKFYGYLIDVQEDKKTWANQEGSKIRVRVEVGSYPNTTLIDEYIVERGVDNE